ncbi:MAG: MexH family multidrug efflux RND transporter periplasmic adaptor subunit [Melioribacteraceae bacterium]|nr:MAG: MexH family multidrug efflux RND transporter periplasmic adaptor subunit [Melioribacteraceae bacterium]
MNSKLSLFAILFSLLLLTGCEDKPAEENIEEVVETKKEEIRAVPVEIMPVKSELVTQEVRLTGVLKAIETVDIYPEVSGKVEKIVTELGARVSKGDTLAYIDSDVFYNNYLQAEAQVLTAENSLDIAEINLKSDKSLFESGDISKLAYDNSVLNVRSAKANLLSTKANLSLMKKNYLDTRIITPVSGYVARKNIDNGAMVSQAAPAFRVVNISRLKVSVGIPQQVMPRTKKGNRAKIIIASLGEEVFTGELTNISPQAEASTGAFPAEITLTNTSDNKLKPGMTSEILLAVSTSDEKMVVPAYSIVKRNGSSYVYKIENSFAVLTEIAEGISIGNKTVVKSGLTDGDKIVVTGMKNLGTKTPVNVENEL